MLLTGGSSGIGAATADWLADKGIKVYATSRSGKAPDNDNIVPMIMDVNDQEAVNKVVETIYKAEGHLDAVICNAGNGIAGAVEDTSIEEARYQFETCYFGAVRTIDACPFSGSKVTARLLPSPL